MPSRPTMPWQGNHPALAMLDGPLPWERLPSLPDPIGFAGCFAGVHDGTLLVAGGANFPDKAPWEGGTKTWHDRIFALEPNAAAWKVAGCLPVPNGYGASVCTPEGVLLIGGGNARRNFTDVLRLTLVEGSTALQPLPSLPVPLAMAAGALLGRTVFVAGGIDDPGATRAQSVFLALDLEKPAAGWKALASWPGPARLLATMATLDGSVYLIGGVDLRAGSDGKPAREWLRDAYAFTPGKGWKRLADLPRPVVAAPSPAATTPGRVLVFGGDDGANLGGPPTAHPGFSRAVLAYETARDSWTAAGDLPFSLVTTTAIVTANHVIIPGGEARPGIRSTDVWAGRLANPC